MARTTSCAPALAMLTWMTPVSTSIVSPLVSTVSAVSAFAGALPGTLSPGLRLWPTPSPQFTTRDEAAAWLEGRGAIDAARTAELGAEQAADGTWSWRRHLASLPADAPAALDDETLWEQLAAVPAPLLVHTEGGPLDAVSLDRFRTQVPEGDIVTVHPEPQALADVLRPVTH